MTTPQPVVSVHNLNVRFARDVQAVKNLSLSLSPGECVALVGESGSGKSVTARSLMGLSGGTVTADELTIAGQDVRRYTDRQWRTVRGSQIAMILQDALSALDPLRPIGKEMGDVLRYHTDDSRAERKQKVQEALESVRMPDPQRRAGQYSTQLSGGMRQRALIAQALMGSPQIVIADEATTALDSALTALVLDQLESIKTSGRAILMISHDLSQVARVADRVMVMRHGEVVESGTTDQVLHNPSHEYTKSLLRALPRGVPRFTPLSTATPQDGAAEVTPREQDAPASETVALRVENLSKSFNGFQAVHDMGFTLRQGQTLGIVGESGSGKTTTARMILGLETPDTGTVELFGDRFAPAQEKDRRPLRHRMGAIYQNPLASFDPRYSVSEILVDALSQGRTRRGRRYREQVRELLEQVRLEPDTMTRNPSQLSGGQRQRLAIARALAVEPDVLVLDEPVSALDVSIQATILDLLDQIQHERHTSFVFISHDLGVIEHMSDQVAVMLQGEVVETGPTNQVFTDPQHEYTRRLLTAVPNLKATLR